MKESQSSIFDWAVSTFGHPSKRISDPAVEQALGFQAVEYARKITGMAQLLGGPVIVTARMNEEVAELLEAVAYDRKEEIGPECADVWIVLSQVADMHGVDLETEVDKKMAKNRARKWRTSGLGVGQHE